MKTALGELLDAVQHERTRILAEIDAHKVQIAAKQTELRRYDRVVNAAGGERKPPKATKKTKGWAVGETKINLVYTEMKPLNGSEPREYTVKELHEDTGLSDAVVQRALTILHEQGRVRLVRKEGLKKIWAVVAS